MKVTLITVASLAIFAIGYLATRFYSKPPIGLTEKKTTLWIEKKWNIYQVEEHLREKGINLAISTDYEGYLHHGKYVIKKEFPIYKIPALMKARFLSKHGAIDHKTLTLASMVEKEMWDTSEASTIAGVFANRLKKGMKLQSDPTSIYGHYNKYMKRARRRILRRDLKVPSPWNTYTIKGLPKTPICTPTALAIHAAKNPKAHDFYYFVGKGGGKHYFSKTFKEHLKYNKLIQKNRGSK